MPSLCELQRDLLDAVVEDDKARQAFLAAMLCAAAVSVHSPHA